MRTTDLSPDRSSATKPGRYFGPNRMNFDIVSATSKPTIAPTRFSTAAMITATVGDMTRVATTVAMAFAESFQPLTKSKASAVMITVMMRMESSVI